jgi:hypothetical protein
MTGPVLARVAWLPVRYVFGSFGSTHWHCMCVRVCVRV